METIIVTGGAGFIGSHVADKLLEIGKRVVCVDNFNDYYSPKAKKKNIEHNLSNKNYFLEKSDITSFSKMKNIFEKYRPDKVIHLAARAGVRPSLVDPFIYESTNVKGTLNLLELGKTYKLKNFVFGSSSSVYGGNKKIPFSEEDRTDNAISPYAATKKAGEVICHTYSHLYGLNITCLRFFTVYGPRGRPDMAPYLFTKWVYEGDPIIRYGDGSSKRDYTFVDDIVSGIISATEKCLKYEIINLGNSQTVELRELIQVIEDILGKKARIIQKPMPKGDVEITYADISKGKKLLGYSPKTDIRKGMNCFIDWFRKNR
ncbi:GDP-mannose 4,6-dehydratase [Candidatus Woesearchaeota archaeon]|nr:GDP-mannose 4,6-dehydratase [Candidatus Woesearchaeota archaeon]